MSANEMPAVGIPRAMLYYRYGALWEHFFQALGVPTVLSPPSSRGILETGTALAPDESCLSLKMFMGHVESLIGRCGQIFIPRYSNYGYTEFFCTRYEGIYDQARNIFRASGQRFITCNIDAQNGSPEPRAFVHFGVELGRHLALVGHAAAPWKLHASPAAGGLGAERPRRPPMVGESLGRLEVVGEEERALRRA